MPRLTTTLPHFAAQPLTGAEVLSFRPGDQIGCWFTAARDEADGWCHAGTVERVDITSGLVHVTWPDGTPDSLEVGTDDMIRWPTRLVAVLAAVRETGRSAHPAAGQRVSDLVLALAVEHGENPIEWQADVDAYGRALRAS